jgi:ECF transporter S component (folate family)
LIFIQPKKEDSIIDNQKIFGSPFHLQYWKLALKTLKNTKDIVTLAMLFSLLLISKLFHLPSGFGNLGIGISYLFLAIICMIYGPFIGFFVGCLSDIIGYFITQNAYAFNLGYTLQAGLACLVYGLCLYRTKITFGKVLLSRTIINLVLNVLYGSLLMVLIYYQNGKFSINEFANAYKIYAFYLVLPKNLVYLLPQSILLYCVIKVLAPILEKKKYLEESISQNITLF